MPLKHKTIQKRYEGFLKTPSLWMQAPLFGLQSFLCDPIFTSIHIEIDEKLRLGKYIEQLVFFQFRQHTAMQLLSENIQIQDGKRTLGELDCLLLLDKKPIHLEIVYKFYLFDATVGTSEIAHCIGPNRKDSLKEKLEKLSQKQLPLLREVACEEHLKTLGFEHTDFQQKVYFKAQLFVPFDEKEVKFYLLNSDCIAGFYINSRQLAHFKKCKFYIPEKKDWLILPHHRVSWLSLEDFTLKSTAYLSRNFSPLCWVKFENGEIQKFFLVWW
ncbi:DUF1853 family protein [Polaribacter sp. BAL334]|uniref:DUF1853 family protein n=1 Tax=Polaribacter sp. BAL334 TaxID=1708178 RepID=UPI0018D1F73B|nr:DUF1853 family protein [Polaribacter sp. BAL334]MBG7613445.1 DUF1853 family protein [Polaribacter sp. BAL334]